MVEIQDPRIVMLSPGLRLNGCFGAANPHDSDFKHVQNVENPK